MYIFRKYEGHEGGGGGGGGGVLSKATNTMEDYRLESFNQQSKLRAKEVQDTIFPQNEGSVTHTSPGGD